MVIALPSTCELLDTRLDFLSAQYGGHTTTAERRSASLRIDANLPSGNYSLGTVDAQRPPVADQVITIE
jgi:hypothetical protein